MNRKIHRRGQFRFKVKKGAFVAINSGTTIGRIENIGRGRLFYTISGGRFVENPTDYATGAEKGDPSPRQTVVSANDFMHANKGIAKRYRK